MAFKEQIEKDIIDALKKKEDQRLSILRMLKTSLQNAIIEKRSKIKDLMAELTDDESIAIVKKMVKQLKESVLEFVSGAREDLAEKAKAEIKELEKYLPEEMHIEELEKIVKETIVELQATKEQMGKTMGSVIKKVSGKADSSRVRELLEKLLQ